MITFLSFFLPSFLLSSLTRPPPEKLVSHFSKYIAFKKTLANNSLPPSLQSCRDTREWASKNNQVRRRWWEQWEVGLERWGDFFVKVKCSSYDEGFTLTFTFSLLFLLLRLSLEKLRNKL